MSVQTQVGFVSNLFSRMMHFEKAGDVEFGHKHEFDHLTLLSKGSLRVKIEDAETVFHAPHQIYIEKDIFHELEALEDDTLAFCIHAISTTDKLEDIVDPSMIPRKPEVSREILFKNRDRFCTEINPKRAEDGQENEHERPFTPTTYVHETP